MLRRFGNQSKVYTLLTLRWSFFGKREVWVRSASVLPKRNNGLMTQCYIWVRQMPIVPKSNNESLILCYVFVRQMPILPKCNDESLIHCYAWVRQLLADGIQITCWCFHGMTFGTTEKITYLSCFKLPFN